MEMEKKINKQEYFLSMLHENGIGCDKVDSKWYIKLMGSEFQQFHRGTLTCDKCVPQMQCMIKRMNTLINILALLDEIAGTLNASLYNTFKHDAEELYRK